MTDVSFYTEDCGKSIQAFSHDVTITNFEVSANKDQLLGFSLILCNEGQECPRAWHLYISDDKGKTWNFALPWVTQAQYDITENLETHLPLIFRRDFKDRILASHYYPVDGNGDNLTKDACTWSKIAAK